MGKKANPEGTSLAAGPVGSERGRHVAGAPAHRPWHPHRNVVEPAAGPVDHLPLSEDPFPTARSPNLGDGAKRPVMVWLRDRGFAQGYDAKPGGGSLLLQAPRPARTQHPETSINAGAYCSLVHI